MAQSQLDRQLTRVRVRLFLTSLLTILSWCWLSAILLAACCILVQPWVLPGAAEMERWLIAGGFSALATVVAVVLTIRRAPSPVGVALALDERFGLKERVTTSRTLSEAEAASAAGQALLADVECKLAGLRVRDRFPIKFPRLPALLLPVSVTALLLLVLYWHPHLGSTNSIDDDTLTAAPVKEEIDEKMKQLAAKPKAKKEVEKANSEELERINREIENFTRAPRETREEVRDRIKDATALEEQIRREQREQAQRVDAFKEAMKQVERLRRKDREKGPGDKASDAVARGDMDAARGELERLSRKLENEEEKERLRRKNRDPKASEEEKKEADEQLKQLEREDDLTREEREQLAKQLEEMENGLKQLIRRKEDKAKDLRDKFDRGEIDKEILERELEQLEQLDDLTEEERKEIEQLAKDLAECKECLRQGKTAEAAEKLAKAAAKCGKCGKDGDALARRLALVQQVRRSLSRSLDGGVGAGRRPDAKDDATAHKDARVPGEWDKGKMEVIGQGPVGGFKGPRKPAEIQEEIRQATQEAPAAIDRQRLPASARKMARGYFEKVRGAEKDGKKK